MDNSKIINISGLVKQFPMGNNNFTALHNINLAFIKGEFCGVVGPSGSGKTTLLNIIGLLDNPTSGNADVLGHNANDLSVKEAAMIRRKHMGFIFQTFNLLPVYTVFENIEFPLLLLKMSKNERDKAVMDALEWVGLTDKVKSKPAQLSGGECQRVAIARAMVKRPDLVLADEPTANLDAEHSHNILQTMEKLNRELQTTFLFATHDEKVIQYLRRKITLDDGTVAGDITTSK
ncbi:MAG TPA: lipoprotein-releasing system ATP-binding protein LolD [Bacteroidales bacterium]|nr:lipoprotein-releasing system ATP-binding protein LolD [Bacteroidales bacterium]